MIGKSLGPFHIAAKLGEGGMGEVYRATDTRLGRTVAIKVLPQSHTTDSERQQRFDREARAVAALSHPNICALFDVGHEGEMAYLVMEYLEGETLAARIARGGGRPGSGSRSLSLPVTPAGSGPAAPQTAPPTGHALPIAETIRIAVALSEALAAAHAAGIIHRDLKPANIMLTKSGVKVLDFGLAKAMEQAATDATMTALLPLTGMGTLLGTVPYMAPEQVEGREADARSDIFALGAVMYEMATGQRAFDGQSQASLIAAILERQPEPISNLEPVTPPALQHLIETCLAKDPEERWQHASDIARQLKWLATDSGARSAPIVAPVDAHPQPQERTAAGGLTPLKAAIAFAGMALVAFIVWAGTSDRRTAATSLSPSVHFAVDVPGVVLNDGSVSPDGMTLAFTGTARTDGHTGVWLRRIDELTATELPDLRASLSSSGVLWSPDGTAVSVMSTRGRLIVPIGGGPVRLLAPSVDDGRMSRMSQWATDDVMVGGWASGLWTHNIATNAMTDVLTTLAPLPWLLQDGRRFLYSAPTDPAKPSNPNALMVSSLDTPTERRMVIEGASRVSVDAGHLLYVRNGTLFAQPFDENSAQISGRPEAIADGITYFQPNGAADFRAAGGTVVYETPPPDDTLMWVDRSGRQGPPLTTPGLFNEAVISPDGRRIVVIQRDRRIGTGDMWLFDVGGGAPRRLTNNLASEARVVWAADNRRIAYWSDIEGPPDAFVLDVDSGAPPTLVFQTPGVDGPIGWLSNDRLLVQAVGQGFKVVSMSGEVIESRYVGAALGDVSPDGRWIAYTEQDTSRTEVYVRPLGRTGPEVAVSRGGGSSPRWSPGGKTLYFSSGPAVFEVPLTLGAVASAGPPRQLFTVDRDIDTFGVMPDGQRFLIVRQPPDDFLPIHVLVNWPAILRR